LDELVFRTKELFETEGLAGFVSLILHLTDERICKSMAHRFPQQELTKLYP
jgi:hypothetical protein